MSRKQMVGKLTTSIALTALLAAFTIPAGAQETAPSAPAAEAPAETVVLPQILKDAGLTGVTSEKMRRNEGSRITGTLPGGEQIGAMLDDKGELRGLRSMTDGKALPQALVDQLVPQNIRDNAILPQVGQLDAVFTGEQGVMLAGKDAQGNAVRAAFAPDGTLIRFGRGDDDRPGMGVKKGMDGQRGGPDGDKGGKKGGKHGRRMGGDHDGKERGPRDADCGDKGMMRGMMDGRGGPGNGDMPPPPPGAGPGAGSAAPQQQGAIDPAGAEAAQIRSALTEAGYQDIGQITRNGPRALAMAVNPEGEPVLVELGREGVVLREVAR